MRALITLLLFTYPRDFRVRYRQQIMHELDERDDPGYALRVAADIIVAGCAIRAESLWRDLRFAVRMLAKAPLFTAVVITTLALAIAGNAVIFSLLDAVLLKPLPYASSDRLGLIDQVPPPGAPLAFVFALNGAERARIARQATSFGEIASVV